MCTQVRKERTNFDHQCTLTFVQFHFSLQFVWPISFIWQLHFPFWINMQCYPLLLQKCMLGLCRFIHRTIHWHLCRFVSETYVQLCCTGRKAFFSHTFGHKGTNTNTFYFYFLQETACCPTGWLLFGDVRKRLTCWLRKASPLGMNVEKTLCCHIPDNHLATTASS